MARAVVTVQETDRIVANAALTFGAANGTDNHTVANQFSDIILLFQNTEASPQNVIIYRRGLVDGVELSSKTIAVPATGFAVFGPMPARYYNTGAGNVEFDVPATPTGLTVAAIKPGALNT